MLPPGGWFGFWWRFVSRRQHVVYTCRRWRASQKRRFVVRGTCRLGVVNAWRKPRHQHVSKATVAGWRVRQRQSDERRISVNHLLDVRLDSAIFVLEVVCGVFVNDVGDECVVAIGYVAGIECISFWRGVG